MHQTGGPRTDGARSQVIHVGRTRKNLQERGIVGMTGDSLRDTSPNQLLTRDEAEALLRIRRWRSAIVVIWAMTLPVIFAALYMGNTLRRCVATGSRGPRAQWTE